jgi:hypothetical protein
MISLHGTRKLKTPVMIVGRVNRSRKQKDKWIRKLKHFSYRLIWSLEKAKKTSRASIIKKDFICFIDEQCTEHVLKILSTQEGVYSCLKFKIPIIFLSTYHYNYDLRVYITQEH